MNNALKEKLELTFKGVSVSIPEENRMAVWVGRDRILTVLRFLKDEGFDHLALISCIDWIQEDEFEIIYILTSYLKGDGYAEVNKLHVILKTRIPRKGPEIDTAIPIFDNAEPYERELHELFGIEFKGHPRLTHLLLERDYETPPFRKDFDTRKYVENLFGKVPPVE